MKKMLALLCALLMLFSASALAEGNFNAEGYPIVNEVVEFTAMVPRSVDQADWNDMWIFDYYEELLGIRFKFNMVDNAAWSEQKNLAFATNSLPDVFITVGAFTESELVNYGSQGYLIDLKQLLLDYSPNFNKICELYPDVLKMITSPDGKIYSAPMMDINPRELSKDNRTYMNTQWLENLGLAEPTTTEELYEVLKAFKEQDANGNGDTTDEIPFGGRYEGVWAKNYLLAAFGFADPNWDIDEEGKVFYVPAHENYYNYLQYMNRLWADGLIDPEFFSQSEDQFAAKTADVRYGFFRAGGANWVSVPEEENYLQYEMIEPITSEVNDEKIAPAMPVLMNYGFSITDQCQNPEILVRWLDYCYSFEGAIATRYGAELGVVDEINGWTWAALEDGQMAMDLHFDSEKYGNFNNMRMQVMNPMSTVYALLPQMMPEGIHPTFFIAKNPTQVLLTNDILEHHQAYYKTALPSMLLTDEENASIAMLDTDVSTFALQQAAKFITGEVELNEASFAEYLAGLEARGLSQYVEIKQGAYDRYLTY